MLIDKNNYPEICHECGSPARTEIGNQTSDDFHGVQAYQFCINYKCIQFDATHLRHKREKLERMVRDSKPFRRHQKRLFRAVMAEEKFRQKRHREMVRAEFLGL